MKQISIVVPVYNVEKYIRACVESVFRQGLDEDCFEVIIVNDGTQDNSIGVISDIIKQHKNIIIVNQKNQGLSVARNNGMAKAQGEYILLLDSDDLLMNNSLKPLLEKALEAKVDLLVADFLRMNSDEINLLQKSPLQLENFSVMEKIGKKMFLEDLSPYECYVWRTLYRRSFIISNHLKFVPNIYFEDIPFTHEAYLKANKCLRVFWPLYIYRKEREGSVTNVFTIETASYICIAIAKTWELTKMEGLSAEELFKLKENIHANVSQMMYSTLYAIKDLSDRVLVVKMLRQKVPDIEFTNGLVQKIETILIKKYPRLYIALRERIWKWHRR